MTTNIDVIVSPDSTVPNLLNRAYSESTVWDALGLRWKEFVVWEKGCEETTLSALNHEQAACKFVETQTDRWADMDKVDMWDWLVMVKEKGSAKPPIFIRVTPTLHYTAVREETCAHDPNQEVE